MSIPKSLKLAVAFQDQSRADEAAKYLSGTRLQSVKPETAHLPFGTLLFGVTDQVSEVLALAEIGAWLVCERTIKHKPPADLPADEAPAVAGIFPMVAHPELGAAASDAHWRDNHAPLALQIHEAMTHYYQLSVQQTLAGHHWDGFALCCFANEDDLRERFYNSKEGERAIAEDVMKFADTKASPRRVIASWQAV